MSLAKPPPSHIGPYQVLRRLGAGGMGVVYEARHPQVPRPVALKQILTGSASPNAVERFLREAEVLARVKHHAVVKVHAFGKSQDGPYIVLELVEGKSLAQIVAESGALEPTGAARVTRDLADAVEAVHALGVLHRDLKPHNAMLRQDGSPVLLDFGLARDVNAERLTHTGEVLGTLVYASPEQVSGEATTGLDARTDVYGLGALLYHLLVGSPPYEGAGVELVLQVLQRDPQPPAVRRPEVPRALDAICRVAMARKPEDRFATAAALRDDLDRFLRGVPTDAEVRLGLIVRAQAQARARRLLLPAAIVAGVMGIGLVAALTWPTPPPPAVTLGAKETPVTNATTEPAPVAPLWDVRPGTTIVYDLVLHERGVEGELAFGATLALTSPATDAPGPIPFECEVTELRSGLGTALTGLGDMWDSTRPDPSHPLALFSAAKGSPFTCTLDRQTGAVSSVAGFATIAAAVLANRAGVDQLQQMLTGSSAGGGPAIHAESVIRGVMNDAFIGAAWGAMTCVRDEAAVGWRTAPEPRTYLVGAGEARACALRPVLSIHRVEDRFRFEGQAVYDDAGLVRAALTQRRVDTKQSMTWSMTRR